MLSNIKLKIANYFLSKETNIDNRQADLIPLAKVKRIGVLFDAKSEDAIVQIKLLLKYFLKKHIDVEILGFVRDVKMDTCHLSTLHINYFNLKDVNLIGVPKSKKTNDFLIKPYDILINLSLENSFATKYLSFKSNAKLKIGMFSNQDIMKYDLLFKLKIKSLNYFIEQLTHYLELINKNNEK
tara:strand:- start:2187 stop:2735 length:549 start_codon:yes stop_codon:yes gene_type:complete